MEQNEFTLRVEYLWVQKGFRESFENAWEIKTEASFPTEPESMSKTHREGISAWAVSQTPSWNVKEWEHVGSQLALFFSY